MPSIEEQIAAAEASVGGGASPSLDAEIAEASAIKAKADAPTTFESAATSVKDFVLPRAEALARGTTLGLSDVAGNIGAGVASEASGYQGPRAAERGIAAPVSDRSEFALGYTGADAEQDARRAALGNEAMAWEMAGGVIPSLATGGAAAGTALGRIAAATPTAIVERMGTAQAARILGDQAVQAGLRGAIAVAGARAVGGAVEGGVGAGAQAAAENITKLTDDPLGAAGDVIAATAAGGILGFTVGGTFGLAEGVFRAVKQAGEAADFAGPTSVVPDAPRPVTLEQAVQENLARPMRAAEIPDPPRSTLEKLTAARRALVGGADEAVETGSRQIRQTLDEFRRTHAQFNEEAGIAAKRAANDAAARGGIALDVTDVVDEADVARAAQHAEAVAARDAATQALADVDPKWRAANESLTAVRREAEAADAALKAAEGTDIRPDKEALAGLRRAVKEKAAALKAIEAEADAAFKAPKPAPAASAAPTAAPAGPPATLDDFAAVVWDKAQTAQNYHGDKAFIGSIWDLAKDELGGMSRADFDGRLRDAQQKGLLPMSRADLVQSMDPKLVASSEITRGKAQFHFVDLQGRKPADSVLEAAKRRAAGGAPAAAAPPPAADPVADSIARFEAAKVDLESAQKALRAADVEGPKAAKANLKALRDAAAAKRAALKVAEKDTAALTAQRAAAERAAKEAVDKAPVGAPPAARRLTKVEAESRGMFDGMLKSIDDFRAGLSDADSQGLSELRKSVLQYREKAHDAMRRGEYGEAYNMLDQGVKRAVKSYVRRAEAISPAGVEFGKALYAVPQQFLEDEAIWTKLAQAQKLANPNFSQAIVAEGDSHWRGLWSKIGEGNVDDWGNATGVRSEAARGLLSSIGEAGGESTEEGTRRALRAIVADAETRSRAWGTPEARATADKLAKMATFVEDTMDATARSRKDFKVAQAALGDATAIATTGALVGAVTGSPAVGLPFVAARWMLSAVSKYRGNIGEKIARTATAVSRGFETTFELGGKYGTNLAAPVLNDKQRAEAIKNAQDIQRVDSPTAGRLIDEANVVARQDPALADALVTQKLAQAKFITDRLPKSHSAAIFAAAPRLDRAAAHQLDRLIAATGNPAKTFDRIAVGTATKEDLDAMRTLYPAQYERLRTEILADVERTRNQRRSRAHQAYLSRVTGVPLSPALERIVEAQRRAQAATQGIEDQGAPQGQGANGADGVTPRAPISLDPMSTYGTRSDRITSGG